MKRRLNPNLVLDKPGQGHGFSVEEHWVFLREPTIKGDTREKGIGPTEIEEMPEAEAKRKAVKEQVKETETVLSGYADLQVEREPHIILTRNCFGFKGPVRLVIHSADVFA